MEDPRWLHGSVLSAPGPHPLGVCYVGLPFLVAEQLLQASHGTSHLNQVPRRLPSSPVGLNWVTCQPESVIGVFGKGERAGLRAEPL